MISKFFHVINSTYNCLSLQSDINSMSDWCMTYSMRPNIAKTRVVSYSGKESVLSYEYQFCRVAITRIGSIKDLFLVFGSKLHFQNHVDFLFSECIKLLGLVRSITLRFSSLDCLYVLYFSLVRSKLDKHRFFRTLSRLPMPTSLNASNRSLRLSLSFSPSYSL
jgi:hypothetical protein